MKGCINAIIYHKYIESNLLHSFLPKIIYILVTITNIIMYISINFNFTVKYDLQNKFIIYISCKLNKYLSNILLDINISQLPMRILASKSYYSRSISYCIYQRKYWERTLNFYCTVCSTYIKIMTTVNKIVPEIRCDQIKTKD